MTHAIAKAAVLAATIALFLFETAPTRAALIFADDFNGESSSFAYTNSRSGNVTRGSVDTVAFYGVTFGIGVDMDGSTGAAGRLETKSQFSLGPAPGTYVLSFFLGKNGSDTESMTVSLGSAYSEVFTNTGAIGTPINFTRSITVAAATTARLVFDHAGGDNAGFILDDVALSSLATSVPEPSSLLLGTIGSAMLGGVALGRRGRRSGR